MKPISSLTLSLLILALGAGCESSGPNTRQGAGIGAVTGGVIGGVVGHQSGETVAGAAVGAAAGGAAGAAIGHHADTQRGTLDRGTTSADTGYAVAEPPPTPTSQPQETMPPRPSQDAVWIAGYWAYTGSPNNPYEWVAGHWEVPPSGTHTWIPGAWQRTGNGYIYARGRWQ